LIERFSLKSDCDFIGRPLPSASDYPVQDVVITGMGIVSPVGIGRAAVWSAITAGRSGIHTIPLQVAGNMPIPFGGEVPDFKPKQYVRPRKSLKVMSRETQLGFTAASLAWSDAGLDDFAIDPERLGVICAANMFSCDLDDVTRAFGQCTDRSDAAGPGKFDFSQWGTTGLRQMYPLWFLKYLPNMTACHISIAFDARGPVNTMVQGDTSALLAIIEAVDVIARGDADLVLAGGTSSTVTILDQTWHAGARLSTRKDAPEAASRPFDADRDGAVASEGASLLVLESRAHALARKKRILATILGHGRRFESCADSKRPTGLAVRLAVEAALASGHVHPQEVGHVNAHGLSTREDDAIEAQAIQQVLGDVPVTAPKSYLGNSGAGSGATELAISLLGLEQNLVPPTLNYERPDSACPVNVSTQLQPARTPIVLALNHKLTGQAVALLVRSEGASRQL
jgi:3-oxoacyl-[acyl-carrier-protein] synthase II